MCDAKCNPEGYFTATVMPAKEDPWQHRSKGMKCKTCMWFAMKQTTAHTDTRGALGRCRRHAPTMNGFPAVFTEDWCGDHKLDETKL